VFCRNRNDRPNADTGWGIQPEFDAWARAGVIVPPRVIMRAVELIAFVGPPSGIRRVSMILVMFQGALPKVRRG